MDANSIDKRACNCGRGLSGIARQSAGSQDSVTDRSGGERQLSFSSTLGQVCSGGNFAGFFQSIGDRLHYSLISRRSASQHSDVRSVSRRTTLSNSSLSLEISAPTTQSIVHVCTELGVLGGQQGFLEYRGDYTNRLYNNLK
jgi:hypothetical protein